jgi:hypothetical protein
LHFIADEDVGAPKKFEKLALTSHPIIDDTISISPIAG